MTKRNVGDDVPYIRLFAVSNQRLRGIITKSFLKKKKNELWQKSFYDEIIRNQFTYDEISKYIFENPMKWEEDELFCNQ